VCKALLGIDVVALGKVEQGEGVGVHDIMVAFQSASAM